MRALRASELVPPGFAVESVDVGAEHVTLAVRASTDACACPLCGVVARRVHSCYLRKVGDLPVAGLRTEMILRARRFFCDASDCPRRVFAERYGGAVGRHARRTVRLDDVIHCLAVALGGRPAATLSQRLNLKVSNDTLLRVVRRRGAVEFAPPTIVGIDDWAWKRNCRYGTLLCDLERRRTVALLPDREPASAQAWLASQPQIITIARDRGGGYAVAAQRALPHAVQVADRWHLMENASRAFLDAVGKSMRQIRKAIGAARIDPKLLTYAEKLQYEGFQRREETNASILSLSQDGVTIREIVRRTGYSRGLIRKILRGQRSDVFRTRPSSLEPYLPWLDAQWNAGCRNGLALWRALRERRLSRLPWRRERMERSA